jgi:polyisoprenoid-binding protein YceI
VPHALSTAIALALLAPVVPIAPPATVGPAPAPAGDYLLDSRAASLVVDLPRVAGFQSPVLRLTKLEGRFHYDPANWEATNVTISADPRSIDASSGPVARTAEMLFEPDRFPIILFTSTSLRWVERDRGELVGDLTFHGVTKPVTLEVVLQDFSRNRSASDVRLRFSGRGRVKRSQFGISEGLPWVGDTVDLVFEVDFVREPSGEAPR